MGYTKKKRNVRSGKRNAREMGPMCTSKFCAASEIRKCEDFTQEDRRKLFKTFWSLPWKEKKIMVTELVQLEPTKKKTIIWKSRRSFTFVYHLPLNNEHVTVCKRFFLSTLGLNEWMATNWVRQNSVPVRRKIKSESLNF